MPPPPVQGCLAVVLHAHLPWVRHPEHDHFLEETWLFEAITEAYLPLLRIMEGWHSDRMETRLTLTLTPTLCAMLLDPLLQERYARHIDRLTDLAEREVHRTCWDPALNPLAEFYAHRFREARAQFDRCERNLVSAFRRFQDLGRIEIITSAATHALLPLMADCPAALRNQILVARDHHEACFGRAPAGIWLPECAYVPTADRVLQEAGIRWFVVETHGLLNAHPRPVHGTFAPVFTPEGMAAFGRDADSARQVWSQDAGYPGDPVYRDFHRDIGFDLDLDYLRPCLPAAPNRSFTGIKYHAIGTAGRGRPVYDPAAARQRAADHAHHFLDQRMRHVGQAAAHMDQPPILVCPYDAELFGHWWYEGPEFLDYLFRKTVHDQQAVRLVTPGDYLQAHPTQQIARPAASSWGEEGYWKVWLNETNAWIYPHLQVAQERMTELVRRHPAPDDVTARALRQASRELMLAQSSDWPFILRTGTSPEYARRRFREHFLRFLALHEQLTTTRVDEAWLAQIEWLDNLFPNLNHLHWA